MPPDSRHRAVLPPWFALLLLLFLVLSSSTSLAMGHVDCSSIGTCTSAMLEQARIAHNSVISLSLLQQKQQEASATQVILSPPPNRTLHMPFVSQIANSTHYRPSKMQVELVHNIVRLTERKENSADQVIAIAAFLLG